MTALFVWTDLAKCRGMNPDLFDSDNVPAPQRLNALKLCFGCPVIDECALDALKDVPVGMVRAGVAFPTKSADRLTRARRLARELGEPEPDQVGSRTPRADQTFNPGICSACNAPMVPNTTRMRPPGVRCHGGKGMCTRCYQRSINVTLNRRLQERPARCIECRVAMVSSNATDVPVGNKRHGGHGRCSTCARRRARHGGTAS